MQKILFFFGFLQLASAVAAQEFASVDAPTSIGSAKAATEQPNSSSRQAVAELLKTMVAATTTADFRPNKGQWRTLAMFRMNEDDRNMQFFTNAVEFGETVTEPNNSATTPKGYLWGWTFVRSDKWVKMIAKYPKGGTNHVIGKDRIAFIASHAELWYEDVYRSIDLRFYGCDNKQFLYDFILQPFAEAKDIQLQLTGMEEWSINAKGELTLKFDEKFSRHFTPTACQYINNQKIIVPIRFIKTDEGHLGYEVMGEYKQDKSLIISQIAN